MEINRRLADYLSDSYEGLERRSKPRIYDPFPTIVRGVDAEGEAFESETVLDNFCAGGLYLRLARRVERGAELDFVIRLSPTPTNGVGAARVLMHGVVLRAESRPCDTCGVAVGSMNYHFL
jgi:hypothetical protein